MNYRLKINLKAFRNAAVTEIQGRTGAKRCIVIPLEDNDVFEGEKGAYVELKARTYNEPKYGNTHFVKLGVSSERYKAMTDEERDTIPFLGNMSEDVYVPKAEAPAANVEAGRAAAKAMQQPAPQTFTVTDELPF